MKLLLGTALVVLAVLLVGTIPLRSSEVDLTQLAKDRAEWPAEVRLTESFSFPVVIGGKEYGTSVLPPGQPLKVVEVLGPQIRVTNGQLTNMVPATATDLVDRVKALRQAKAEKAANAATGQPPNQGLYSIQYEGNQYVLFSSAGQTTISPKPLVLANVARIEKIEVSHWNAGSDFIFAPKGFDFIAVTVQVSIIKGNQSLDCSKLRLVDSEGGTYQPRWYHLPVVGLIEVNRRGLSIETIPTSQDNSSLLLKPDNGLVFLMSDREDQRTLSLQLVYVLPQRIRQYRLVAIPAQSIGK